jgi:hypothetical protein
MSLSNNSEVEEDQGFLQKEVIEFTESDRMEAILSLQIICRTLTNNNDYSAQDINILINKLQQLPAPQALEYLQESLKIDELYHVSRTKSFLFLKQLTNEVMTLGEENRFLEKKLASHVVLSLMHNFFYKIFPCPNGSHCKNYPRKIVHKNDFSDREMDCFFYHHEKDRRRFVLSKDEKEFCYAGNFGDGKKANSNKHEFSQNFFESLFHPLYYKNFYCVRSKCQKSIFCPYYHSVEEKNIWGNLFKNFFGKDRDVFTKKRNTEEEKSQKFGGKHTSQLFNKNVISNVPK